MRPEQLSVSASRLFSLISPPWRKPILTLLVISGYNKVVTRDTPLLTPVVFGSNFTLLTFVLFFFFRISFCFFLYFFQVYILRLRVTVRLGIGYR